MTQKKKSVPLINALSTNFSKEQSQNNYLEVKFLKMHFKTPNIISGTLGVRNVKSAHLNISPLHKPTKSEKETSGSKAAHDDYIIWWKSRGKSHRIWTGCSKTIQASTQLLTPRASGPLPAVWCLPISTWLPPGWGSEWFSQYLW